MAEKYLDCLGEACPVPLVKTQNAIKEMNVGDVLVVGIDHTCAMKNVPDWARGQGYNVEIEEVLRKDLLYDLFRAYDICARFLGGVRLLAFRDDEHPDFLTRSVGKNDGAAHLLIRLTGIHAQTDVKLYSLVELSFGGRYRVFYRRGRLVSFLYVYFGERRLVFLSETHVAALLSLPLPRPWSAQCL